MKLGDLEPEWLLDDGRATPVDAYASAVPPEGVRYVGILFLCPCARCRGSGCTLGVRFANPIGGGAPSPPNSNQIADNRGRRWTVVAGMTFETLTLSPSIDVTKDEHGQPLAPEHQHWHGFVQGGVCTNS